MSNVEDRVKDIIVEELGVEQEKLTTEASFMEDLGADSLDTVEAGHGVRRNSTSTSRTKKRRSCAPWVTLSNTSQKIGK